MIKKMDLQSFAGLLLGMLAMISVITFLLKNVFPVFSPASYLARFVESSGNIGQQTSSLLWSSRYMDLIAEAFLVLAAAACCIAMLKTDKTEREEK